MMLTLRSLKNVLATHIPFQTEWAFKGMYANLLCHFIFQRIHNVCIGDNSHN